MLTEDITEHYDYDATSAFDYLTYPVSRYVVICGSDLDRYQLDCAASSTSLASTRCRPSTAGRKCWSLPMTLHSIAL